MEWWGERRRVANRSRSLIFWRNALTRRACARCWSASVSAPAWLFRYYAKIASLADWWYGENPPGSFARSYRAFENLCDTVSLGDPKRPVVPGDRGQEPPDRGREPAQVRIPRQHVA